jgi:hypothetical protein
LRLLLKLTHGIAVADGHVALCAAPDQAGMVSRYMAIRTDALPWLIISERGQLLTRQIRDYLVAEAAARAELPPVHPQIIAHGPVTRKR